MFGGGGSCDGNETGCIGGGRGTARLLPHGARVADDVLCLSAAIVGALMIAATCIGGGNPVNTLE